MCCDNGCVELGGSSSSREYDVKAEKMGVSGGRRENGGETIR